MVNPDPFYKQKPNKRLGDAPLETQFYAEIARVLDTILNGKLNRKIGFCLMIYPFGDHHSRRCNYVSNGANRTDVVALMKEMIARFEGQPEQEGNA